MFRWLFPTTNSRSRRITAGWAILTALILGLSALALTQARKSLANSTEYRIPLLGDTLTPRPNTSVVQEPDQIWTAMPESKLFGSVKVQVKARAYRVLELNPGALTQTLSAAPLEFTEEAAAKKVVLTLPGPEGGLGRFQLQESPLLSSELANKFPEIKTYRGQGIDDPSATMRLSWTPRGLNAFVLSSQGSFMVSPADGENSRYYVSFFTRDVEGASFECLLPGSGTVEKDLGNKLELANAYYPSSLPISSGPLREYRISFTVTQQFYQHFGGPFISPQFDPGVTAAIMAYLSNVNLIYEQEVGSRFKLQNWYADRPGLCGNPFANCFSPDQSRDQMIQPNQAILDFIFGPANYDIGAALGYAFATLPSGLSSFGSGGPSAGIGAACENSYKGQSATVLNGIAGDYLGTVILAHEWGHMFGARHTFTSTQGACGSGQLDLQGIIEPGSGSTIMSYAPVCGIDNLFTPNPQAGPDSYFHVHSLFRIVNHKSVYSACGQTIATGNSPPVITDAGAGANIPAFTPFTLTAAGTDPNSDTLTYDWEEWDPGLTLFRSYPPITSPSRTFPSLTYILNNGNFPPAFVGGYLSGEGLPSSTRTLSFTVTVRDNHSGSGGTVARDQLLAVNVVGTAGPFRVTQPNTPVTLIATSQTTIAWNVAGTNLSPINTSSVRILLSTDGGSTFPTILANSTPNDGSETVTLPNVPTLTARIKIEAIGNIYFDVSDTNFVIAAPPPVTTVQLGGANFTVNEGDSTGHVNITLTRSGNTSSSAAVSFATNDGAGLTNCNVFNGMASPRCDYENTIGTASWAAGDATAKTFSVAIVNDSYAEGTETFTISLNNPSGATLGAQSTATVTITDNDATNGTNPIDTTNFLVRQLYIDFLGREPDPPGLAGWAATINNCSGDTTQCDRIHVAQLFFQSAEFQDRGYFVYRFYPVAFGRKPDYGEFVPDLASVSGFLDANQLEAAKVAFIAGFMARPAFVGAYNGLTNQQYVDALLNTAGVTLSSRQTMINGLNASTMTRAQVLRQIVESTEVSTKYNHQAYAVMEYFGYLRRQPDSFYLQWIQVLDSTNDPRGMVTGFVTSQEYRNRFGP